ncbi:MAG: hypothetical protein CVU38_18570 [Chloroflexi bacterium HGW-Chloroflexi-1]|nr:MAG: hypothetical protein CVU38_18570 [Chloroflexi bacterium HGW-Chloroflexi-1]
MALSASDHKGALSVTVTALTRSALADGRMLRLRVVSGSMRPLLRRGDEVIVAPVAPAALQPGDLVVRAASGDDFVVHRLMVCQAGMIVTRGDCLPRADPAWPADQLAGRVVEAFRQGRPIAVTARWPRPVGRLLAGLLLVRSLGGRFLRKVGLR